VEVNQSVSDREEFPVTTASAKKVVARVVRLRKLNPAVRKQVTTLPAKNGKIVLDRKNPVHAAWMHEEEGEEDLY
jgi:hypothetical protein